MNRMIKQLFNQLSEKPKTLFLVDSLGALLTAFLLFVVIRKLNPYVGMSTTVLTYLAATAGLYCIYSFTCFLFLKRRWTLFIRIIGIANLFYCALTTGLLIKYYHLLTILGTSYFLVEITIIAWLSYVELKVASEIKHKP